MVDTLGGFHHLFGAESFELQYSLRPPKCRIEEWTKQLMHGHITESEIRERLRADAQRPLDLEMLSAFCDAYQTNLVHYSGVLQSAAPSDIGTSAWRIKEKQIDEHVAALRGKLPLWREHLEKVFEFLEEMRITSGAGLLKLGEFEATSAHWLAHLVFNRVSAAWQSCRDISARSHRDPRYLYAAKAIDLFGEKWLASFPSPQHLSERLREEFVLARAALKRGAAALPISGASSSGDVESTGDGGRSLDNESRELALAGEMQKIVAQAGHIFRPLPNSDWGIGGEIEFKDRAGQASGLRLYVQLKAGDSYLVRRKTDGEEVFTVKKVRHLEYWSSQAYPVMLVIQQSSGLIRWMDVSAYLRTHARSSRRIIFRGERVTIDNIHKMAEKLFAERD